MGPYFPFPIVGGEYLVDFASCASQKPVQIFAPTMGPTARAPLGSSGCWTHDDVLEIGISFFFLTVRYRFGH